MRLVCSAVIYNDHERECIREMFCRPFATAYNDDSETKTLHAEYTGEVESIKYAFMETFSKYNEHHIEEIPNL